MYYVLGRSINVKSAGLVGRHGPQSKQPFMGKELEESVKEQADFLGKVTF